MNRAGGCAPWSFTTRSHHFTLQPRDEGGSCFEGPQVAALMTDKDTFQRYRNHSISGDISMNDDNTCMMSAGKTSVLDGVHMFNAFENGSINLALTLSFLIGVLAGVYVAYLLILVLFKRSRDHYIASILMMNQDARERIMRVIAESSKFAIVTDTAITATEKTLLLHDVTRVLRSLDLGKLAPPDTIMDMIFKLVGYELHKIADVQVKISDLASTRFASV